MTAAKIFSVFSLCAVFFAAHADMAAVAPLPANPVAAIHLPDGFHLSVFARLKPAGGDYFRGARMMAVDPDGNLYLSLGMDNKVVMLPDRNHDGVADEVVTVAHGLDAPQGLAFVGNKLYVANQSSVVRLEQKNGKWSANTVIDGLPGGGHTLKTLKLGPDGFLYLNVGSSCNVCQEQDPLRATLLRYTVDGKPAGYLPSVGRHPSSPIWAQGLRNTQGFAWHPVTGEMFATNNGADMRTSIKNGAVDDSLPPEHLNRITAGSQYGWPHCWGDQVGDPNFPGAPGFCATMTPPVFTFPAHATPIGMTFLDKTHFPSAWHNDALVALHGSWNRQQPSGYKLVRVHFEQGKPVSASDFASGWLTGTTAWGRPVDVVAGADGAVYVSDDRAGLVYRISYEPR